MSKILIADDEPSLRLLVRATLSVNKTFEIIEASDGHEALAKAQNDMPDLLLLDVMMPGLSGFEVCERLKNDSKTKKNYNYYAHGKRTAIRQGLGNFSWD